jgi:hypothetical protein
MATITSAQSGNFSDTATWVGGVVPTSIDDAVAANGHIVDIDVDVTCISINQAGTGRFRIGNGRILNANVIINAGTRTSRGTLECTATTTATVNGNVSGASSTLAQQVGIFMSGSGNLNINGTLTGTPGNVAIADEAAAVYTDVANCLINITGNVTAGTGERKAAILINTSSLAAIVNITGNVSGNASGNFNQAIISGGTVNVTGNVASFGSNNNSARAITSSGIVNVVGNVTGASGGLGTVAIVSSGTVTVTGNVSTLGGSSSFGISSTGTVTVTGNVNGGSTATNSIGISSTGTVTVTGAVTGGSGAGAFGISSTGTVTVTGNVTGGGGAGAFGISTNNGTVNIIGNVIGSNTRAAISNITNSSIIDILGVVTSGITTPAVVGLVTTFVILRGNIVNSDTYAAIFAGRVVIDDNVTSWQYKDSTNTITRTLYTPGVALGNPAEINVRNGTTYGPNNEFTGSLSIPPSGSVALGVPVDNGFGTAMINIQDMGTLLTSFKIS